MFVTLAKAKLNTGNKYKRLKFCGHQAYDSSSTRVYPNVSGLAAWNENCK
jgi:hypothetical protein